MTLAEISALGLPAIVVPYPHHKDRHQFHNSEEMTGAGGALVLEEGEGAHDRFAGHALEILSSPERREAMSEGARRAGRRDGARRILELILEDIGETKV